jgi:hypothetical protein
LTVSYDLGADTQIPVISHDGMIVVSVLLGLDIASLLTMAIYSAVTPRWTNQFDSFAMMRIGAAMSEHLPLHVAHRPERIEVLSGFIGDVPPDEADIGKPSKNVGELGLGAAFSLRGGMKYTCYPTDLEKLA